MKDQKWLGVFLVGLCWSAMASGEIVSHEMSSESQFSDWTWRDERLVPRTILPKYELLAEIKRNAAKGEFNKCAESAAKARPKFVQIESWLFLQELTCRWEAVDLGPKSQGADESKAIARLEVSLKILESHPQWLLWGASAELLRGRWRDANLKVLEFKVRKDPKQAWDWAHRILKGRAWLNGTERGRLMRAIGDLAFRDQKLDVARQYYRLSLQDLEDDEIRTRLKTLENSGEVGASESKGGEAVTSELQEGPIKASTGSEADLRARMEQNLKSSELMAVVEDGVKLLKEYPGGTHSKWAADRIYEIFVTVAEKEGPTFATLKKRSLELMKTVDSSRISKWAGSAFRSGFFDEAGELAEAAHLALRVVQPTVKMLEMSAYAHYLAGRIPEAKSRYLEILEKHSGAEEATGATFMLALLAYRSGEFAEATGFLERLRNGNISATWDVKVRYWFWRALEKVDKTRAVTEAQGLAARYPVSYYGLRAAAELNDNNLGLPLAPAPSTPLRNTLSTASVGREFWVRLEALLRAGWYEEAQSELQLHADWIDPKDIAFSGQIWAAAFQYPKVISIFNRAWEKDPSLLQPGFVKSAFPILYQGLVEEMAGQYKVDAKLVRSLMRQESAFAPKAVSSSGALGLMQMIPPTAKETAQNLGVRGLRLPQDLFEPRTNIRFCTYYLSRMLAEFEGSVPAALAAYNSGPSRLKRWMKARKLTLKSSSDPLDEMWFDELPWEETQFYVKAILRNLLIYRALDRGPGKVSNPIWGNGTN